MKIKNFHRVQMNNKKIKSVVFSQITILMIGIFAFAWSLGVVSGKVLGDTCNTSPDCRDNLLGCLAKRCVNREMTNTCINKQNILLCINEVLRKAEEQETIKKSHSTLNEWDTCYNMNECGEGLTGKQFCGVDNNCIGKCVKSEIKEHSEPPANAVTPAQSKKVNVDGRIICPEGARLIEGACQCEEGFYYSSHNEGCDPEYKAPEENTDQKKNQETITPTTILGTITTVTGTYTGLKMMGTDIYGIKKDGKEVKLGAEEIQDLTKNGYIKDGKIQTPQPTITDPSATGSWVGDWLLKQGANLGTANAIGHIASGIGWAGSTYLLIQLVGGIVSDEDGIVDALANGAGAGILAGKSLYGFIKPGGKFAFTDGKVWGLTAETWSIGVGAAVGIAVFIATYEKESTKTVQYSCEVWEPSTGGDNCEKCNQQGILPCSEYQCRSLGQSCELINVGTDKEQCVWVNDKDITYPVIITNENDLLEGYSYEPFETKSPPERGAKIINLAERDGCVPAFTPISFGINTSEPAKCKIDYVRKTDFEIMEFYV